MLGIMKLVLAFGLYEDGRHGDACTRDIERHSGILKHLLHDLLSCYERDEAPRRAFGTSPVYNPSTYQYSL